MREGYWHAPLEANAEMNAEYIIFTHFMDAVDPEPKRGSRSCLLERQQPDGSWSAFPGRRGLSVDQYRGYFALKLAGMRAGDEAMVPGAALDPVAWRHHQVRHAGALLPRRDGTGAVGGDHGAAGGDMRCFPNWFPVNVYELSSWARGTLFGLMLLQAAQPVVKVSYERGSPRALYRAAAFHQLQAAAREEAACRCAGCSICPTGCCGLLQPPSDQMSARAGAESR